MTILASLAADARVYGHLRFPNAGLSFFLWARLWCSSPGLWVLASHRVAHRYSRMSLTVFWLAAYKIWPGIGVRFGSYLSKVLVKCDLQASTEIEDGVFLSNHGHIVLGARSIGSGTVIHSRVTIGMDLMGGNVPEIGRNVWIGPECVLYGEITVGDGATVLPCTVLTKSIPPGSVVQGNPARIVKRQFDNSRLRNTLSTDYESIFYGEPGTPEGKDV